MGRYLFSFPMDKNGHVWMVHDIVTDTSQNGSSDKTKSTTSDNDKTAVTLLCSLDNFIPRLALNP